MYIGPPTDPLGFVPNLICIKYSCAIIHLVLCIQRYNLDFPRFVWFPPLFKMQCSEYKFRNFLSIRCAACYNGRMIAYIPVRPTVCVYMFQFSCSFLSSVVTSFYYTSTQQVAFSNTPKRIGDVQAQIRIINKLLLVRSQYSFHTYEYNMVMCAMCMCLLS